MDTAHTRAVCIEEWFQVQLVHDTMHYPPPWAQGTYQPRLYVDEFWLTNDALISLNSTEQDKFTSQIPSSVLVSIRVALFVAVVVGLVGCVLVDALIRLRCLTVPVISSRRTHRSASVEVDARR